MAEEARGSRIMNGRQLLSAGIFAGILAVACSVEAKPKPPLPPNLPVPATGTPLRELWYDFTFYGTKVGFLHARDESTTINGQPAFLVHRWSVVTVRRLEQVVRIEATTDTYFAPDGTPMRFAHKRVEGKETRSVEGYRDGDQLVIRNDVGGNLEEKRIPMKGGTTGKEPCTGPLYLASSLELLFNEGLNEKKLMAGCALDESEGVVSHFTMSVLKKDKDRFVIRETLGPVVSEVIVLQNGDTERTTMVGIGAEFVRTTQEKAVAMETTVDIFSSGQFALPKPLPAGHTLDSLVVQISSKTKKTPKFLTDARQQGKVKGNAVELTLKNAAAPMKAVSRPIKDPKVQEFLKETQYESIHDERLVAASQKAVGDLKDAWAAAKAINRLVHGHIRKKSLARAFATASEAFETGEGDCTEHSVLFSALAKIAGIPTRLATGLVYVGGDKPVFGYHEWVEVSIDGQWIAMDPTFGQDLADPTHIKFAVGQSDPDGIREAGMVAAALIGELELKVISYVDGSGSKTQF
jgi:hypothetical protein